MGGIAGWLARGAQAPDDAALLPALEALAHRGGAGDLCAFATGGGHRVVLGLAHYDPATRIALALDGDLANRDELKKHLASRAPELASASASEILVQAYLRWDKEVLQHLRGAFAFALWDARKERLMLARDRFGEKPLYLCERGAALYFASELRALARIPGVPAEPDPAAVRDYLACRYVPGPRTLIGGVRKIQPGTFAAWQFGRVREVRYWSAPDRRPWTQAPVAEPVAAFTEKLDEAVRLRLPAGILLSGGVDSAALVALAARHATRLKTYSAGFADDRASELKRAARVAKRFGSEHHEIVLSPRELVTRLPQVIERRDAPVSRPGDVALHFMACEAARSTRAVLTGDGADEVLGGYRRHAVPRFLARWMARGKVDFEADPPADPAASSLRRALYRDQATWLPDNVLERADRMTMAASLEARAPFLDHPLVELVSRLPDDLRVRGFETKWILRRAARPLLEGLRPRQGGWRPGLGEWLRGELREFLVDHLRGSGSRTRELYDPRALDRALDEHLAGRRNHETLLWTLLNLEIWHRTCAPRA